MKGIVLAGGTGSRLWPITRSVSKQLLPVFDKPLIHYPISTLMLAGVREILLITTPQDQKQFRNLLGDGSHLGISIKYELQPEPKGLAQALTIGEKFLDGDSCLMILGDNIFHGVGLGREIARILPSEGSHVFVTEVNNPSNYGVLEIDDSGNPVSVIEKPQIFISSLAVTGLYFFDSNASNYANSVKPSQRGELEITSVIEKYLVSGNLSYTKLSRGSTWLDAGTFESLSDAGNYVRVIEERTGLKVACLEEIAIRNDWVGPSEIDFLLKNCPRVQDRNYLISVLEDSSGASKVRTN
jgi:glucose-1-phosphate thymidylyltransferase